VGEGGRLLQGLGVLQPLGLGGQLGRLPHPELGGVDLLQLVAEQVDLALALAGPGGQVVQLAGDAPQRRQPAAKAARSPSTGSPAKRSSRSRWTPGRSRSWNSCWPWTSTRGRTTSATAATVAMRPWSWARLRPSART
jgi:hypothetical protein